MKEPKCKICGGKHYQTFCPYKKRKTIKKRKKIGNFGFKNQVELFDYVWNNTTPKECFVSGINLEKYHGTDRWHSCFMHILPKGRFTKWKLNPDNIRLGDPYVHHLFDQGTEEQRRKSGYDFTGIYKLKKDLTLKYRKTEM